MAGSSNITGDESIIFCDNMSFDGTERGGKMTTNGELWIGSTTGRHVRLNTLTAGSGITITNGPGSITIASTAGPSVVTTLSDDVNTIASPSGSGNIQLVSHVNEQGGGKFSTTVTGTNLINVNPMSSARWIVDPLGFNGTHTTIASAITSATSGDTILLLPGTYTENLTLKAGVNLTGQTGDDDTPTVTISGKLSGAYVGTVSVNNIRLQTNSDYLIEITGSDSTILNVNDCYINATNNTAINYTTTNAASSVNIRQCFGNLGTTGISVLTKSSTGAITFFRSYFLNTGGSTTANTNSASECTLEWTKFSNPFTTSDTGSFNASSSIIDASGNTKALTLGGSGDSRSYYCYFNSGTATAVSANAANCYLFHCTIGSSNTNAIDGSGTLRYGNLIFSNPSSKIAVTSAIYMNSIPAFSASLTNAVADVTGAGAVYTVICDNELFDKSSNYNNATGVFTAPVTGYYQFNCNVYVTDLSGGMSFLRIRLVTTASTFERQQQIFVSITETGISASFLAPMTIGDTASMAFVVDNGAGNTADLGGASGSVLRTTFSGFQVV